MSGSPENTAWARTLVDELVRSGLRDVVVAPGSRSTPLVLAAAAEERLRVRVHLDERSCGFFALGVGKATGAPAAVITTSGTAVANLLPAVVEASQTGVPLLILSADRPSRLRGADANQAIEQHRIFGGYPRAFFQLDPPSLDGRSLRHLRTIAARAWAASTGHAAGPVHINVPFDKPLEPAEPPADLDEVARRMIDGRQDGARIVRIRQPRPTLSVPHMDDLLSSLRGRAGVIIAGPNRDAARLGPAARRFAQASGLPLLADPLSGARFGPDDGALVVSGYDLFLSEVDVRRRLVPDVILRVGASPTSASLQRWLFDHDGVEQIVIDDDPRWKDHGGTATSYLRADATDTLTRLARRWVPEPGVADRAASWRAVHEATDAVLAACGVEALGEAGVAASVVRALPDGASLFVSSSMPIRDVDAFARPGDGAAISVFANRGASGIDGVVSSAFGVASCVEEPTALLIGDVALFHDQNGLLWSREPDTPLVIVVVDNDGGAIFGMLPVAEHDPDFTRFFTTPHGIDPSPGAGALGIDCAEASIGEVEAQVAAALKDGRTTLLRVRTSGPAGHEARSRIRADAVRSALRALG